MYDKFFEYINKLPIYNELNSFLDDEYANYIIYPKREQIFNAFKLIKGNIKVVIIGQDPYSNKNQANGLAFSVNKGVSLPPSLRNICKEIGNEFGINMNYSNGDLTYLASQGVLLLNTILTVREKEPLSHDNKIYKELFLCILKYLDSLENNIVFLLWGNNAKKYEKFITNKKRLVIATSHPSPLSANRSGWFNSSCFINTNKYLESNNIEPIHWENTN